MSHSFRVITLGCKVNQYESVYIREVLVQAGWRETPEKETADVVIVNTCIVTQRAAHQSRRAIRKAIRENPHGVVAAVGCYPQAYPEVISKIPGIGVVAGNMGKAALPQLLVRAADSRSPTTITASFRPGMTFEPMPIRRYGRRTRAFLKIQDGCHSFCSYCIVPYARGPSRSLPAGEVLRGLQTLCEAGYPEIVLTGVHLGNYGADLPGGVSLMSLLRAIGEEQFPARIRLSSLEPNEIRKDLLEMVSTETWLCPHFHIPLQSGDDAILNWMNRPYRKDEFTAIIRDIHDQMPDAAIGVDVIAGFPGEDSQAHRNTCSVIQDLPVSYLHVFPFSPRPGTAAARFAGRVDSGTIKERAAELRRLGAEKRARFYESCVNRRFSVLAENRYAEEKAWLQGTSENYLSVLFPSSPGRKGEIVTVLATAAQEGKMMGVIVDGDL